MELEILQQIVSSVMNVDAESVKLDTDFVDDLSCDSIEIFQIIMGIEEEYGFEIPTDDIQNIHTVRDAIEKIKALKNEL
ncbi:MAG: acyl carrier protein [Eubacteriales bacterium]|nr:acyl carrier protein [Eubacteriales bacterium]